MTDFEFEPSWLDQVGKLNAVVASAGQPLMGNLFYDHLQADYLSSRPNPILRPKRDRFRQAVAGRARLLEVGVNGGHSAFLALTSNPALEFHGVDICEHAYVKPAVEWLKREFPGRVFFYEGDCRVVLPRLARDGRKFDAFHIDGAKFTYFEDIRNCQKMLVGKAVVMVDDTQQEGVAEVVRICVRHGRIKPLQQFPPMPSSIKYRNEIGELSPPGAWQSAAFRLLSPARRFHRSSTRQRLESTLPVIRREARRARSLARHPVGVMRRRMGKQVPPSRAGSD